jgi:hypothetical protein
VVSVIQPPLRKFAVVLGGVALASFAYVGRESVAGYLIPISLLLFLLALFAFISDESEERYRYCQKTEEALKRALREMVQESLLAEERTSETSKKEGERTATQD